MLHTLFSVLIYCLMLLLILLQSPPVSASSLSVEKMLKESLRKAMACESGKVPKEPVIALSPARFLQAMALIKKDIKDSYCAEERLGSTFHIEDPRTWGFCVAGSCEGRQQLRCRCYNTFGGTNCEKFHGHCWLMYCMLSGCSSEDQDLKCACDPDLQGKPVRTGDYWYDDGLQKKYRAPSGSSGSSGGAVVNQQSIPEEELPPGLIKASDKMKSRLSNLLANPSQSSLAVSGGIPDEEDADNEEGGSAEEESDYLEDEEETSTAASLRANRMAILCLATIIWYQFFADPS